MESSTNIITVANITTHLNFNYNNLPVFIGLLTNCETMYKKLKILLPVELAGNTFPKNIAYLFYESTSDTTNSITSRITTIQSEKDFISFAKHLYNKLRTTQILKSNDNPEIDSANDGTLLNIDLTIGFEVWSNAPVIRNIHILSNKKPSIPSTTLPVEPFFRPFIHSDINGKSDNKIQLAESKTTVDLEYDDAFLLNIHYAKAYLINNGISKENIDFDLNFLLHKHINFKQINVYQPMP